MADIVEVSSWETGIYQIEQTDPVLGGPPNIATGEGLTNVPIQQLANRTVYLFDAVGNLDTALTALENTLSAADFTDTLSVSGVSPLMQLTETDEGAATNQAGLMLSDGELLVQAETGIVRLTGWSGADMTLLTAKFAGVDQPIVHGGMLAAVGVKGIAELATSSDAVNAVESSKIMTAYRTRQAIDAALAGTVAGGVGSYAFLGKQTDGGDVAFGATHAGADLFPAMAGRYSSTNGAYLADTTVTLAGTWRCMGNGTNNTTNTTHGSGTLWLRIL